MARKSTNNKAPNLKKLREQIDKLDGQILKLLNDRASLAAEIGQVKNENQEEPFAPAREEEVVQRILANNPGPLEDQTIRAIYREIVSGARSLQKVLKVAYLGPEDSFGHLAAVERFGQSVEFVRVGNITAIFEEINRSHADFGVVPLENSTDGRISDTLDMFLRMPQLIICAEIRVKIQYHLLASGEQEQIRRIYAVSPALSQCRNWLSKNVPHASLHEVATTQAAAQLAQGEASAAAVASSQVATRYGLRKLFSDIQDSPNNETRYAVIGRQKCDKTGNDKTALVFRTGHTAGALVDALDLFKQNRVNLTWIESFPAPASTTSKPESVFFVDFEGHTDDTKVSKTIKALEDKCKEVIVLGSYPRSDESV